jgi:hypothetical protein
VKFPRAFAAILQRVFCALLVAAGLWSPRWLACRCWRRRSTGIRRLTGRRSQKYASFEKRMGGNGRSSPSSPSNARWNGRRGAGPCQALAAEGGGRQARLYKGQASPATIATGGAMGCRSNHALAPSLLPGATSPIRNSKEPEISTTPDASLSNLRGLLRQGKACSSLQRCRRAIVSSSSTSART